MNKRPSLKNIDQSISFMTYRSIIDIFDDLSDDYLWEEMNGTSIFDEYFDLFCSIVHKGDNGSMNDHLNKNRDSFC